MNAKQLKTVEQPLCDKLLVGRGTVLPNAKSDKISAIQNLCKKNCNPIKKLLKLTSQQSLKFIQVSMLKIQMIP